MLDLKSVYNSFNNDLISGYTHQITHKAFERAGNSSLLASFLLRNRVKKLKHPNLIQQMFIIEMSMQY